MVLLSLDFVVTEMRSANTRFSIFNFLLKTYLIRSYNTSTLQNKLLIL